MFVAPLVGPYSHHEGLPLYLDGYAYAGLVNFQTVQKEWPATAELVDDDPLVFESFEKSSSIPEQMLGEL